MVHFVDNAAGEIQHNCNCCGVCATVCPVDAIEMDYRKGRGKRLPASTFGELHELILDHRIRSGEQGG